MKEGDNVEEIKSKTQELSQAIQKVGTEMYQKGGEQKPPEKGSQKPEEGEYRE